MTRQSLKSIDWYTQVGEGCYASALANFLLFRREYLLAQKVYREYRAHPLVRADGASLAGLALRLLRDLTHGQYEGTLHLKGNLNGCVPNRSLEYGKEKFAAISRAIICERKRGTICTERNLSFMESLPTMLAIERNYQHSKEDSQKLESCEPYGGGHWIVACLRGIIDDGKFWEYNPQLLDVQGAFVVTKSPAVVLPYNR